MINRNNYEEYFLLLADNELSPVEETAVKQFAAKHPDLQEELDILLSCRLDSEPMPVFPKEKLLRTTLWDAENPEPVQTQMLLLLDGELPATEQQQLHTQIAANAALQAEWKSLQQTKMLVETIIHPNKETLHHTDRKVRPLLWIRWAAAAAVVAGLGWLLWMQQEQKSDAPNYTLALAPVPQKTTQQKSTVVQQSTNLKLGTVPVTVPATQTVAANTSPTKNVATATQPPKEQQQKKESSLLPEDAGNVNTTIYAQTVPIEPDPVLATLNSTNAQLISAVGSQNSTPPIAHLTAKPIAISMLTASQKKDILTGKKEGLVEDEIEYVTVGGARINRQKVRGLLRNVTRSVARTFSKSKLEPDVYATR